MAEGIPDRDRLVAVAHAAINDFVARSGDSEVGVPLGTLFEEIDGKPPREWDEGSFTLKTHRATVCEAAIDHALGVTVSSEATRRATSAAWAILVAVPGADYNGQRPTHSINELIKAINRALRAEISPSVGRPH